MLNTYSLERNIEEQTRETRIPGLALSIVRGDQVIYARGFGVTSVEDAGLPVTPQTLFCIGSISKVLTGTAIMRLIEAGRLDLDRPITEYLPWLTLSRPGAERRITLRMLLSHTSGLRSRNERSEARLPREPAGLETFIRRTLPQLAFIAEPGTVFAYCNPGLSLAGYIAETIAGKYFPDLMQELVFNPLEMRRTTYDRSVAMTYAIALPHQRDAQGNVQVIHFFQTNTAANPAGFAMSNVLDLSNLAIMHLDGGLFQGRHVLARELAAQMHTLHADLHATPGRGYGLTFWIDPYQGRTRIGHGGHVMSFRCYLELVPAANIGLVLLANRHDFGSRALDHLVDRILDQLLDMPPPAPPQAVPQGSPIQQHYLGQYWSYLNGAAKIVVVDGQLVLDWNGWQVGLRPLGDDRYFSVEGDLTVGFVADTERATTYLLIGLSGWSVTFSHVDPAFVPDPTHWEQYAGVYLLVDDLVDYVEKLTVRIMDGQIFFNIDTEGEDQALGVPISDTAFATKYGLFEFQPATNEIAPSVRFADEFVYVTLCTD